MKCKVRNPYFNMGMNEKFVFGVYEILQSYDIDLTDDCTGIFIDGQRVGIIDTEQEYIECPWNEMSIYEAFDLIPEGMRYDKELDKLVPNIPADAVKVGYREGSVDRDKIDAFNKDIKIPSIVDAILDGIFKSKFIPDCKDIENDFIKFNQDKIDFSLIDAFAYEDLGKCLTFGAKKYSKNNWIKGDLDTYIAALERHLTDIKKAVQTGDKKYFIDKDSGLQHGANLLCNAMFIHYFIRKKLEKEDEK